MRVCPTLSAAVSLGWEVVDDADPASTHYKPPECEGERYLESVREDLVQEIRAPSSRCRKGGRGKLGGPSDPQTSCPNRKVACTQIKGSSRLTLKMLVAWFVLPYGLKAKDDQGVCWLSNTNRSSVPIGVPHVLPWTE